MAKSYRNVIKTKKAVRAAFVELVKEKRAIERITVAELAERADIAKSTFYYHYDDVYAVAEEFENELVDALYRTVNEFNAGGGQDITAYVEQIMEFIKDHDYEYRCICRSTSAYFFLGKLKTMMIKRLTEEAELLCPEEDVQFRSIKVHYFVNACVDTLVDFFQGTLDASVDQIKQVFTVLLKQLFLEEHK